MGDWLSNLPATYPPIHLFKKYIYVEKQQTAHQNAGYHFITIEA